VDKRSGQWRAAGSERLERAVVLLLLSGESEQRWSCAQLAAELSAEDQPLEEALGRLARAGVVSVAGADVTVSPAVWRIDELGLIGI
jgi:DNA-binding GntR family transcriptional regulator